MFCRKGFVRNLAKFVGKHLCQSLFLAQVFSCEFCEISKNTFSYRTPLVPASVIWLEKTVQSSAMDFWTVTFFKLTLGSDCLEHCFCTIDFKNHPDSGTLPVTFNIASFNNTKFGACTKLYNELLFPLKSSENNLKWMIRWLEVWQGWPVWPAESNNICYVWPQIFANICLS